MTRLLSIALLLAACAFGQKPLKPGLYAIFKTDYGTIRVQLFEKDTPVSVSTFVGLSQGTRLWRDPDGKMVKRPMYDNTTFFRIIPTEAIQGGSPTGRAAYNCGLAIRDEMLPGFQFRLGSLAIANSGTQDSGGCQFFFTAGPKPSWNMKYAIFGQAVEGLDAITKIANVPVRDEEPVHPPKIISVTIERIGPPPTIKKPKD